MTDISVPDQQHLELINAFEKKDEMCIRDRSYEKQLINAIISEQVMVETAKETAKAEITHANIEKGIIIGKDDISGDVTKIRDTKVEGEKVIIEEMCIRDRYS